MMWKLLLGLVMVIMADACTEPGRLMTFADFAKRSEIVALAEYVSSNNVEKTFKVTKLFAKKRDNLMIGSIISIKTSSDVSCAKYMKIKTKYILFLKKSKDQKSYEFQYKAVKASFRNYNLFQKFIKGTWTGIPILISGCRRIPKPMNGFISCTKNKANCRISCKKGFELATKTKYRRCDQKTGIWYPKKRVECIPVVTEAALIVTSSTVEPRVTKNLMLHSEKTTEDSVLQRLSLLWRKRQLTSTTAVKATDKPLAGEDRKLLTSVPTSTVQSGDNPRWVDFLNSPPAILRAANTQHSEEDGVNNAPVEEDDTGRVVLGSESDITWLDNGIAVVTGKGDEWEAAIDPFDPDSAVIPYLPVAAPDESIYGCPGYHADVYLHSIWQGGFSGQIIFRPLQVELRSSWMVCIQFSHPITGLDPSNAKVSTISADQTKVCLEPQGYNRILYLDQSLHIGLIGSTDPTQGFHTTGTGTLLGGCPSAFLEGHVVGTMFEGESVKSFSTEVTTTSPTEETTVKTTEATTTTTTKSTPVTRRRRPTTTTTSTTTSTTRPTRRPTTTKKTTTSRPRTTPTKPPTTTRPPRTTPTKPPTTTKRPIRTRRPTTTKATTEATTTEATTEEITTRRRNSPIIPRFVKLDPLKDWEMNRCRAEAPNGMDAKKGGNTAITIKVSKSQLKESDINYNDVLYKSNLFYEAQRSGMLKQFNRIPWRGHSALKDGCEIAKNLTGGWHNDGGHVKSTYPIAFATTMLSWGFIEYKDAYMQSRENQRVMSNIKWAAKYLMACHVGEEQLVAQVGNYLSDKGDWGRAEETKHSERTVYTIDKNNPSPEIVAETVAALSAAGIVFKLKDPAFSAECLSHAKQLHSFATKYSSTSFKAIPSSMTKYSPWPGANDDLAWASVWLSKATNSDYFLEMAEVYYKNIDAARRPARLFYWDDKTNGAAVMLAKMTNKVLYKNEIKKYINEVIDGRHRTPIKQVYLNDQAPNSHTANAIFLALLSLPEFISKTRKNEIKAFASEQMGLLLGTSGRSFVVGCGPNPPKRPHHMGSSCGDLPETCTSEVLENDRDNPHILYGALVAGADKSGNYQDSIKVESYNEVSVVINAGFQSAAAGLKYFEIVEYKKRRLSGATNGDTSLKKTQG